MCFSLLRSHCQSRDRCFQPGSLGSAVLPQRWHWQWPPRWPFPNGRQAPLSWQGPLPWTGADGSIKSVSYTQHHTFANKHCIIIKVIPYWFSVYFKFLHIIMKQLQWVSIHLKSNKFGCGKLTNTGEFQRNAMMQNRVQLC